MTENCKLPLEWFRPFPKNNKTLCIIGGAPSLKKNLGKLKEKVRLGAHTMTTNGTLNFLTNRGLAPDYHAQFDARPQSADFINDTATHYLIGSMSDPLVFSKLEGHQVTLWHGGFDMAAQLKILEPYQDRPIVIVGGGSTIGLRAIMLGFHMGYRKFVLFGVDSSFSDTEHHAYEQKLNDMDKPVTAKYGDKTYQVAPWMYRQAMEFENLYEELTKQGCSINVIGEGLIPDIGRKYASRSSEVKSSQS